MPKKENKEVKQSKDKKSFSKSMKAELKKVVWPTPKQLFNNTVAVLSIVLLTAAIVFVLDFTFEAINKHGINRLKESISASNTASNNTTDENQTNETDSQNGVNENNVEENAE